jgi:hypothetical protein
MARRLLHKSDLTSSKKFYSFLDILTGQHQEGKAHSLHGRKGNRPLGRPRYRPQGNFNYNFKEAAWRTVGWIDLAQDRDQWCGLLITIIKIWAP